MNGQVERRIGFAVPSTTAMPNDCNDTPSTGRLESTPRRLPAVPVESRRISRPLPKIPRSLVCKNCGTCISSYNVLLPLSSVSGVLHCFDIILTPNNPRYLLIPEPSEDFRARPLCLQKRGSLSIYVISRVASSDIHLLKV